jgi:hypothetical protein
MQIKLVSRRILTPAELELLDPTRGSISRRGMLRMGAVGIVGAPLFCTLVTSEASAQGAALQVAKYMFRAFSVDAVVRISQEARA